MRKKQAHHTPASFGELNKYPPSLYLSVRQILAAITGMLPNTMTIGGVLAVQGERDTETQVLRNSCLTGVNIVPGKCTLQTRVIMG